MLLLDTLIVPQINWNAPLCFANEYACNAVLNWIITSGFTQFVVFPTRETTIVIVKIWTFITVTIGG